MTVDVVGDLDELLGDFAESATFHGNTFNVIMSDEYSESDIGSAGVSNTERVIYTKSSNLTGAVDRDPIVVSGATYLIASLEEDGQGLTRALLNVPR